MEGLHVVKKEIKQLELDQQQIKQNIRELEVKIRITEKDMEIMQNQLEKINGNTTWTLRVIIGALLTGILGMFK